MRAAFQPADLAPDQFAPALADAFTDQALQDRLDLDAGRIRRRAHRCLGFANGHAIVDRQTQTDVVNGVAGPELVAVTVAGLDERLGVDQSRLDFPEPFVAQIAVAFDRSLVHGATPCRVTIVVLGHQFLSGSMYESYPRAAVEAHSLDNALFRSVKRGSRQTGSARRAAAAIAACPWCRCSAL